MLKKKLVSKGAAHPRNRHQGRYDFNRLTARSPELGAYVAPTAYGDLSIDFSNPEAVQALNRALLADFYGIVSWVLPAHSLCPPVPGRADYIHSVADLLAENIATAEAPGSSIRALDVGVGANCIYPIIGRSEYGWTFVGADIDPVALASAQKIIDANSILKTAVELRHQKTALKIFDGVVSPADYFDLVVCNPPFHASFEEAQKSTARKWSNLGKAPDSRLNFGGNEVELSCEGGEAGFIQRMITESADFGDQVGWFTTLVSKEDHLLDIYRALNQIGVSDHRTLDMAQGQKKSRIVAWTFAEPLT